MSLLVDKCPKHGIPWVRKDITSTPIGQLVVGLTGQKVVWEKYCPKCRATRKSAT
jgi:hypothetical protein